jgi:Tol biopolymer transport system component
MHRGLVAGGTGWVALTGLVLSCSSSPARLAGGDAGDGGAQNPDVTAAIASLAGSQWNDALSGCLAAEAANPSDCDAQYCELIARTMLFVNEINTFLLPRYRRPLTEMPGDAQNLATTEMILTQATQAAEKVAANKCQFELPTLPLVMGDATDPVLNGEVRGLWTPRDAHMLAALFEATSYGLQTEFSPQPVSLPPDGGDPALPPLLESMREHLLEQDQLLFSQPADPSALRGGWYDANGDGKPDLGDQLLIDIFKPGTNDRVLDYSKADFVKGESLPLGALTPTASLQLPKCGYQMFHIDDVVSGSNVLATDGMTFSPDGTQVVVPLDTNGTSELYVMNQDGTNQTCLTCGQPGNNDGVRWRPGTNPDTLLFISDRDHPDATGNAGGGFGQELYAMHTDGSDPTRLTVSDTWATNYHANWSPDGTQIIWGSTESYAWDVMTATFTEDATGMHLTSTKVLVHDTTWWETHGFTADNQYAITTNTHAGFLSTDLYAIEVATGARTRLTSNIAWDEHGHLSPDGREIAWISGRWHPAAVYALNDGSISPVFDWLWVIPGIFFEFLNAPAGYSSELTLMDADGSNIHALTSEDKVIADNEWSPDGTRIIFRETDPSSPTTPTRLRILTFDDCQ